MRMPILYTCINCEGKFPNKEFNHDSNVCKECLIAIEAHLSIPFSVGLEGQMIKHENAQLKAIIEIIDKTVPLADSTCDEPGITFSEACRRQLIEDKHPLFIKAD